MLDSLLGPCMTFSRQRDLAPLWAYGTLLRPRSFTGNGWHLNKIWFIQYFRLQRAPRTGCHSEVWPWFIDFPICNPLWYLCESFWEEWSWFCCSVGQNRFFIGLAPKVTPCSICHRLISIPYPPVSLIKAFCFSLVHSQLPQRLFWGNMRKRVTFRFLYR